MIWTILGIISFTLGGFFFGLFWADCIKSKPAKLDECLTIFTGVLQYGKKGCFIFNGSTSKSLEIPTEFLKNIKDLEDGNIIDIKIVRAPDSFNPVLIIDETGNLKII